MLEEELYAIEGNGQTAASVMLDIIEAKEILSKFIIRDQIRRFLVVFRHLTNSPNAGFLSALRQALS